MKHHKAGRKLGRNPAHRRALFRNLLTDFFKHGSIETTEAKAKAIRPQAEKLITLAKRGGLHARRQVAEVIRSPEVVRELFDSLASRYEARPGGYTRILRLGPRVGDGAPMVMLELVDRQ